MKEKAEVESSKKSQAPSVIRSVCRPSWVTTLRRQPAVVVGDGSGSMIGDKARDAALAIQGLNDELAKPVNKDAFAVAVLVFDETVEVREPLQRATELQSRLTSLDLVEGHGGTTNITQALEKAEEVVDGALRRSVDQLRPVVLVFTDGEHNTGPTPFTIAKRLKKKADVVTVAFGADDQKVLKGIATSPQHYYRCKDGASLRAFMAAVGATLTTSMAQQADATQPLAALETE